MDASFDFADDVVLITGVGGTLGSAVAERFLADGATVCGADVVTPADEDFSLAEPDRIDFYGGDFTDERTVSETIEEIAETHGGLDALCNVAGTWQGGDPIHETDVDTFELLFDVNLRTMFLTSKHAIPHLRSGSGPGDEEASGDQGAIVSISARSSLEGGEGDGPYRAAKAGVRLLTETIAAENRGEVRANAVMPSVIDTPMNREMMPDADFEEWVDPDAIARVIAFLCSEAAEPTSGAAVPVYGEA